MSKTLLDPRPVDSNSASGRWMVTIFNNDRNSVDEVIDVLMRATHCSMEEASIETWEAHTYGRAHVHFSLRKECESVALVIESIGVKTEVSREWKD